LALIARESNKVFGKQAKQGGCIAPKGERPMAFKATVRNQRISHFVAASALGLAEKVSDTVGKKLETVLRDGETLPDLKLMQELVGRYLDERGLQLLEVDDRYSNDQVNGRDLQIERGELVKNLRRCLTQTLFFLDSQFGREKAEAYLPKRNFSKSPPAELLRLASQAILVLQDPQRAAPSIKAGGVSIPSADLVAGLETAARQLQELLDRLEGLQARQKQIRLEEKSAEIEASSTAIKGAVSLLGGFYIFADLPFHAQRLRRRVARRAPVPEEGAGTGVVLGGAETEGSTLPN